MACVRLSPMMRTAKKAPSSLHLTSILTLGSPPGFFLAYIVFVVASIKTKPDLSVIVTAHREGYLIYRTLRSLYRARLYAEKRGLKIEFVVIRNSADAATTEQIRRVAKRLELDRIITKDFGPVGPARNYGAKKARADIISICDGDDLYSENWLYDSYLATKQDRLGIWHPQFMVGFDGERYLSELYNQNDSHLDIRELLFNHFWSAIITTRRENLLNNPTPTTPAGSGFAYEDWAFNMDLIAAGCHHRVVPNTARFYRSDWMGNTTKLSLADNAVAPPSDFFSSRFFPWPNEVVNQPVRPTNPLWSIGKVLHRVIIRPWFSLSPKPVRQWLTTLTIGIKRRLRVPLKPLEEQFIKIDLTSQWGTLPPWLIIEAQKQSEIEPLLFTDSNERWRRRQPEQQRHSSVAVFSQLLALWPDEQFTQVWLLPRLAFGGAEHSAIEIINTLVNNFGAKILVLITEPIVVEWRERLVKGVVILEVGVILQQTDPASQSYLLFRLLSQKRPPVVVNLNDAQGWRLLRRYAKALSSLTKIFVIDYLNWSDDLGRNRGYGRDVLPDCLGHIQRVITDNEYHRDYLRHYLGCPNQKVVSLTIPFGELPPTLNRNYFNEKSPNVLWAARLDSQKQLDLLLAIAQRLPDYKFYVYGQPVIDKITPEIRQLERLSNLKLMGTFENITELQVREYCCFLHTAATEGIPITLLLMMLIKLPVVASAVGGVPEIINRQTGFLIEPYEDVSQYVAAIKYIGRNPARTRQKIAAAHRYVLQYHSRQHLKEQLAKLHDFSAIAPTLG